ncbi:hypothetical protein BATDEDRAFT_36706 [Batrachochytrium dendrobatidis JAM81]|uniref:HIG1 domain-containing protein n=2 Tax=Batrachochytrium dendrobatidis TaxID=109871 RepID=F4NYW6_BATDJ|nr:uncharacterized protein BATDEDRAFT_36706 [Batrachochytrium dendrobatidis JAM81]EGF82099.1 hypothetical protein BATDEDRAFT_36706 [Batrachochytrium dendrobatidis JAM81]KAJ8324761.1 Replication factor C, subunit RFC4 [Batrachochytrium dendrobatidis]KAK5671002.1 Replication factor C, subunit RFC4 [Batrachochytrium dendrobatidis]OAJ40311.1 hypothetical protein BDEG_24060 [Batrachochytrium dendrobatidis JEL423]|eukprot:XP_006677470.1 hypothetical protein BATDEDRAFT_36706 [Batrachochytrium dendrobatidis JAM81]
MTVTTTNPTEVNSHPVFKNADEQHNWVLMQGAKSSVLWGSLGGIAHMLAQRTLQPYQRLSLPFKSFLLIAVPMAAFFTTTDRAAMEADRIRAQRYSITREDELNVREVSPITDTSSTNDKLKHYLVQNKYSVLGYTWLGVVGLSLAYNFTRPNTAMSQKLINSRMVAQSAVLLGFAGLAALSTTATPTVTVDPHYERIMHQEQSTKSH